MSRRSLYIEEFNELLHKWNGEHIKISKGEMGDHDEATMHLSSIEYTSSKKNIDDYESEHMLKLNGEGYVKTAEAKPQPLPHSVYDIPLEDHTTYEFDGHTITLTTERGTYTIERISSHKP